MRTPSYPIEAANRVAIHVFGNTLLEPVAFLGEGTLNNVLKIQVPEGAFVIRLCKEGPVVATCEQESRYLRWAQLCGVPAPSVRAFGDLEGQAFLVETLAPGTSADLLGDNSSRWWEILGRHARRIHDINTFPTCDLLSPEDRLVFDDAAPNEWRRFVAYNVASLTINDPLLTLGVYTAEQRDNIAATFERLGTKTFRFGLNHNDLDPRHLFIASDGNTTLIDWGCAEVHLVPHYELAEVLRWHTPDSATFRAFRQGYGLSDADFAIVLPQVRSLQLIKAFDLVRWAIDRCPERIDFYTTRARTTWQQHHENARFS